ncbi:hypothetical protein FRC12_024136 [Ceratobasidium sp. 428]|nr:hypothetical protein FRC12_024136 [Ceratobasidium sp. 428]
MITSIILYYIYKNRTKGSPRATQVLTRVARITFESQLPPTVAACALSLTYLANENSFLVVPILVVKLKSYGISFLHTLNSREAWKQPEPITANQTCKLNTQPTQWATGTVSSSGPPTGPIQQDFTVEISVVSVVTEEDDDVNSSEAAGREKKSDKPRPGSALKIVGCSCCP